jgi:hypothetical protein
MKGDLAMPVISNIRYQISGENRNKKRLHIEIGMEAVPQCHDRGWKVDVGTSNRARPSYKMQIKT